MDLEAVQGVDRDHCDSEDDESVKEKVPSKWKASVKGSLHWGTDSDEEVAKEGVDPIEHAFTQTNLGLGTLDDNTSSRESFKGGDSEGIVGERVDDTSGLTDGGRWKIDELCAQEGVWNFPDSKAKAEDEQQAKPTVEETKVMTRSEAKKAGIHPPPVNEAEHPDNQNRKSRSTSSKQTSPKVFKSKHPFTGSVMDNHKKQEIVSDDMLGCKIDSQQQSEPSSLSNEVDSPEQMIPKVAFAAVTAASPKEQIPSQAKTDTKEILPAKGQKQLSRLMRTRCL